MLIPPTAVSKLKYGNDITLQLYNITIIKSHCTCISHKGEIASIINCTQVVVITMPNSIVYDIYAHIACLLNIGNGVFYD